MVSSNGSELGAAKLTGEILKILESLPNTVKDMTGIDIQINQETAKLL